MKKKLLWLAVLGCCSASMLQAQQDPQYTHFTYNKLLYNPAYAGASDQFCLNAVHRQQYMGFEDQTAYLRTQKGDPIKTDIPSYAKSIGPKTTGLAFSAPLGIKVKGQRLNIGGVYGSFIQDRIAYETSTFIRGGVAGAFTLADGSSIRAGFEATYLTKGLNPEGFRYHDPNDPNIPTQNTSDQKTTFGAGVYYQNPNVLNGLWGGISLTHLVPQTFTYGNPATIKVSTVRHLYIIGGVKMDQFLGNPLLTLEPSFMIKSAQGENGGFVKPELDLQGMVTYNDLFAGGINFRSYALGTTDLGFMLGYYPPIAGNGGPNSRSRLRVGYCYDLPINNLIRANYGSHELQLNYCFTFELPSRPPRIYRHPRYMNRIPSND